MLKSDTEDSTDVDDLDYKEKAKLLNLSSGILRERLLESDTDDSNDPTWEENTKWPRSSTGVPQKTTLRSNAESGQNALSRQPEKKKGRGPGRPKKKVWRGSVSVIHKPCEEEKNTQAVKGCKETPKTVMTSSNSTRQAERQVEEPYRETRIFAPLFRRPVCKRLREKCSVTGCPHADEAQSPTGLWLFALPDKTNEAELYSEWLRHVPIDDSINRPLSPRKNLNPQQLAAAQELQPPTTPVVGQESKCETSADVGVECHSVTPSGAAHKLQSMTASALIAMVQEPRSMTPVDDSSVSQPVKTNEEATKLQSTTTTTIIQQQHSMTSAAVTAEAQCLMAGGVAQESQPVATSIMGQELQSLSSADATSKSKPVGTEEAQNLHSTISATIARKSKSVTLADVGAETQPMMTAGVGQGSQCTCAASVMQASQSTTFDYDVNLQSQPVAIDKLVQKSWTAITASGAEESHCTTSANVTAETESKIAEVTQELQPTGTAIMVQESQCMAFENVSSEPPPVETDGETQKLEFAINSALVQELHSVASADIAAQTLSMTSAGVAQKSQSTAASGAAVDCDQHSKGSCESQSTATFADQGVESRSTEAAGTANGTQCTTGAAMSQEPESMDLVNTPSALPDAAEVQIMTTHPEVEESRFTATAATGLQSVMATSMKRKPQSGTVVDGDMDSVRASGAARESQSAMMKEPQLQALSDVLASTLTITAAPKACKTESSTAAAMVQEPGSVTLRDIIIEPKMVIAPRVAQESHYMTISGVDLKTATTVVKKQKLQPTTFR
ncbi:hypothetical protein HPB51_006764 [Rhipicephalus microplus]|uniref:Uncharacterized protein n=1 Tax=Rhipicephalus microplus TaxID=6941 RepID=A0A9J6E7Y1_RHIMP|nr:hypothetical protein HPB51_006764 [Rhipicephalus microplus]